MKDIGVRATMGTPFYFAQGAKDADVSGTTTGNADVFATVKERVRERKGRNQPTRPFYFAAEQEQEIEERQGERQEQGQGAKTKAGRCLLI